MIKNHLEITVESLGLEVVRAVIRGSITEQTYPLPERSQFGKLVAPIYHELSGLPTSPGKSPDSDPNWLKAAFGPLRRFTRKHSFRDVDFTTQDIMFASSDEIGAVLRRPILHRWASERFSEQLKQYSNDLSVTDQKYMQYACKLIENQGYSRFFDGEDIARATLSQPGGRSVYIGPKAWPTLRKLAASLSSAGIGLAEKAEAEVRKDCLHFARRAQREWMKAYRLGRRLITDPGHLFNVWQAFVQMLWAARPEIYIFKGLPRLPRPTSFMFVEDNPLHQWVFEPLRRQKNAEFYAPTRQNRSETLREQESKGCYVSAERALDVLTSALKRELPLPRVLLADIELGNPRERMNGIEFVKRVHQMLRDFGRRDEVIIRMLYSSNLSFYQKEVDSLYASGVISDFWTKEKFSLRALVEAVVNETEKGSSS